MKAVLTLTFAFALAASANAQQLKIAFNQGHVSVDATSVPARTILAEWTKAGGTKITGAERMSGAPLTLKLIDVPEAQALDIILRSAAGYMAAPRNIATPVASTASMYDRILVMATTTGTAAAPASNRPATPANSPNPNAGLQRFVPPGRVVQAEPDDEPEQEEQPERPNQPVFTFPQPGQNGFPQVGFGPQGGQTIQIDPRTGQPQTITINPAPPATTPGAFGVIGAPTPGMIQQPPPAQPGQPGSIVRPPGRQQK